ncbi:MAG: DNA primase [Saprospiraceae bacterium]|nr:DNA primase [Saprospiraceae bacterium]
MISQKTIDEIFQAVRVEEVIDDFVKLKKRGINMIGLCPFHDEKTPSFTVSPTRNIYKCFGCGKGGNAVNFLMEHDGLTYPEALRNLAARYKIEIEETGKSDEYEAIKSARESLHIINEFAGTFYRDQLFHTDMGKSIGLGYFKQRGILRKTIDQFELGYAPQSGDQLTKQAIDQGYNIELLRQLGLTTSKDRDFFFNRVIFPIHNVSGKIVAFAGRQLGENKKSPKYINSKESDVYHKSKVLYGLHLAKTAIRKEDQCILVEGYTDVISLHQSGISHVVASSGTALTVEQIKLVKRYTQNILLLYDGDAAGIKAAMRGVDLILAQDMNVRLVTLPEGADPDSYVNEVGTSDFQTYLSEQATDFIHFKARLVMKEAAGDPIKKAELVHDIINTLAKLPDQIKRSIYIKQCADLLEMDESLLLAETNKVLSTNIRNQRIDKFKEARQDHRETRVKIEKERREQQGSIIESKPAKDEFQEKDLVRILLLHGAKKMEVGIEETTIGAYLMKQISGTLSSFDNALYARFVAICRDQIEAGSDLHIDFFTNHSDKEIQDLAIELCTSPYHYSDNWENRWQIPLQSQPMPEKNEQKDTEDALLRFILRKLNKLSQENLAKIKEYQALPEFETELMTHMATHQKILAKRNEIAAKLNTVVLE